MKGIFLKEMYLLRSLWKSWLFVAGIMALNGIAAGNMGLMFATITFIGVMCTMTAFGYDSSSHWDAFALSLPVTRRQMVLCRYGVGLASMGLVSAALLPLSLLILALNEKADPLEMAVSFGSCLAVGLILLAVLVPVIYKFGVEKARYLYVALIGAVGVLIYGLLKMYEKIDTALPGTGGLAGTVEWFSQRGAGFWAVLAVVAAVLAMALSYLASVKIYSKKEF